MSRFGARRYDDQFKFRPEPGTGPLEATTGLHSFVTQRRTLQRPDGRSERQPPLRKTVDYNASGLESLDARAWMRDYRDRPSLQPDPMYYPRLLLPSMMRDLPIACVAGKFVMTSVNKDRFPNYAARFQPNAHRLIVGNSDGQFTLWNGLTFNFETLFTAHTTAIRAMEWSHNANWMITSDDDGYVMFWQPNMNSVKKLRAHKNAVRGLSFAPTDLKFVTASDDATMKVMDFAHCHADTVLQSHGSDVKSVHWHPTKGLIASGSKDNTAKLWDPRTGTALATLYGHKNSVQTVRWNANGHWLLTGSRDQLLRLYDIRTMRELQVFRGHRSEVYSAAWHPVHEDLLVSGALDGTLVFHFVGLEREVGAIRQAHDECVWDMCWHPLGNVLATASNDKTVKFWTCNRPGDALVDGGHVARADLAAMAAVTAGPAAPADRARELDALPGLDAVARPVARDGAVGGGAYASVALAPTALLPRPPMQPLPPPMPPGMRPPPMPPGMLSRPLLPAPPYAGLAPGLYDGRR